MKMKARFDYLTNFLLEYASSVYSSAELIATFQHIPGSNTAIKAGATAACMNPPSLPRSPVVVGVRKDQSNLHFFKRWLTN
jgi:hypothetical protein